MATKKSVKKKVVKKTTKKPVKKIVKQSTVSKTVKKQVNSNKKNTKKALTHNKKQDVEIAKLKEDISKLKSKNSKKKVNSKRISEYNLFIRKQINAGYTFAQAVKEWNRYQALMLKNTRKPSAYNQFVGSQMRLGKTFKQSAALWKLAKSGQLGKKGTTKTITKVKYKTRNVKSKPEIIEKIKYRTKKVAVPKVEKVTNVVEKIDYNKLQEIFMMANKKETKTISTTDIVTALEADDEDISFRLVQTYFKEIARFGFKKQLTLDEIIDAYIYALARVKRNENLDVAKKVKDAGMRK